MRTTIVCLFILLIAGLMVHAAVPSPLSEDARQAGEARAAQAKAAQLKAAQKTAQAMAAQVNPQGQADILAAKYEKDMAAAQADYEAAVDKLQLKLLSDLQQLLRDLKGDDPQVDVAKTKIKELQTTMKPILTTQRLIGSTLWWDVPVGPLGGGGNARLVLKIDGQCDWHRSIKGNSKDPNDETASGVWKIENNKLMMKRTEYYIPAGANNGGKVVLLKGGNTQWSTITILSDNTFVSIREDGETTKGKIVWGHV